MIYISSGAFLPAAITQHCEFSFLGVFGCFGVFLPFLCQFALSVVDPATCDTPPPMTNNNTMGGISKKTLYCTLTSGNRDARGVGGNTLSIAMTA